MLMLMVAHHQNSFWYGATESTTAVTVLIALIIAFVSTGRGVMAVVMVL